MTASSNSRLDAIPSLDDTDNDGFHFTNVLGVQIDRTDAVIGDQHTITVSFQNLPRHIQDWQFVIREKNQFAVSDGRSGFAGPKAAALPGIAGR